MGNENINTARTIQNNSVHFRSVEEEQVRFEMKWNVNSNCSQIAVGFVIIIQITAAIGYIYESDTYIEIYDVTVLPENIFENKGHREKVIITRNNLTTLHENTFKPFNKLNSLQITANHLTTLPENIFRGQTNLRELYLQQNRFVTLPAKIFQGLHNLWDLYIQQNRLATLPGNLFTRLTQLKMLDIHENHLTILPENLFQNQGYLWELYLQKNQLETLPATIFRSQCNLGRLHLAENQLKTLPEHIFQNQKNLWELDLQQNMLKTLPENLFESLTELETLKLNGNQLTTLPANIFRHQTKIVLAENPWTCDDPFTNFIRLNKEMVDYKSIFCIDGEPLFEKHNRLTSGMTNNTQDGAKVQSTNSTEVVVHMRQRHDGGIETFSLLSLKCNYLINMNYTMIEFDCSSFNLRTIPTDWGNRLHMLPLFWEIKLNIQNNRIERLPNSTQQGFELITTIVAKNNLIKSIDVSNLPPNLTEMDLCGNKLESLSSAVINKLNNMKTLRRLVLAKNPWFCMDPFFDFIRLNKERIDYKKIACNIEALLSRKSNNRFIYWIKNDLPCRAGPKWMHSKKVIHKLRHRDDLGMICPTECNCFITERNSTISYECLAIISFTRILNYFDSGRLFWPLINHRRLIF